MYVEMAIKEAEKVGYIPPYSWEEDSWQGETGRLQALLSPLFWQALGKSRGWVVGHFDGKPTWLEYWHRFIDHLAEGKSAESYFEQLFTNHTN